MNLEKEKDCCLKYNPQQQIISVYTYLGQFIPTEGGNFLWNIKVAQIPEEVPSR